MPLPTDEPQLTRADDDWIIAHSTHITRHLRPGGRILELGCGGGRDTVHLAAMAPVVAIDVDHDALARCRERAPSASLVRADLSRPLPLPRAHFDVIVASLAIHYFPWRTTQLLAEEIARCAAPGGLLVLRVNSTNDHHYGAASRDEIEPNYVWVDGRPKRFFDRETTLRLFRHWKVERIEERTILRYGNPKSVWEAVFRLV